MKKKFKSNPTHFIEVWGNPNVSSSNIYSDNTIGKLPHYLESTRKLKFCVTKAVFLITPKPSN